MGKVCLVPMAAYNVVIPRCDHYENWHQSIAHFLEVWTLDFPGLDYCFQLVVAFLRPQVAKISYCSLRTVALDG